MTKYIRSSWYVIAGLFLIFLTAILSATACGSQSSEHVFKDDEAQLIVVARLVGMAQTPEAKEYIGLLFPSVALGDWAERHENLKAWKYVIDKWPAEASEGFNKAQWFHADFDEYFSSFNRPTWVIYDHGRIVPQGGALLVEADIDRLNRERNLYSKKAYNAYVVSSDYRTAPIIDSETGKTIGQAYNGFAVSVNEVRDQRAYFYINISDPSIPNAINKTKLHIPIDYMKKTYVEPQQVPAIISLDMIYLKLMAGIGLFEESRQQVIARFNEEIGPIQFIQNIENGYLFILGMNLVHVNEQEVKFIEYND